jgi:hypothetical protein
MGLFSSVWQRKLDQAIMLLTSVREFNGSNLCWHTKYPDWDSLWFTSVPPCNHCDVALKWPRLLSSISFTDHYLLPPKHTSQSLRHWQPVPYVEFGSACHALSPWLIAWLIPWPGKWRLYVSQKRRLNFKGLHGVTDQKIELFSMLHKLQIQIQTTQPWIQIGEERTDGQIYASL